MSPAETAAELCRARGGDFREEMEAHLLHGYVFATPTAFLMGRPMPRSGNAGDLWRTWPRGECDAWFVWIGVGDAAELLAMTPFPLPWIGWYRQGREWQARHWQPMAMLQRRLPRRSFGGDPSERLA